MNRNRLTKKKRKSVLTLPTHHLLSSKQSGTVADRLTALHLLTLLPLLIVIGVVPLIVFLKVTPVPSHYQQFWITEYVFDFFSYYKAQLVIFCAGFVIVNALVLNHFKELNRQQFPLTLPLIIYATMIVFSTLLSDHFSIALNGFFERYEGMWTLLAYLVLMVGTYLFVNRLAQIWILLGVWAAALCIIAVLGLFQLFGMDFFQTTEGRFLILPGQYERIASSLNFNFPQYWIYATLYNPNNVASMMTLAVPLAATGFFLSQTKRRRIGFGLLTILFMLVLAGTHARGGWVAILCSALLLSGVAMHSEISRYWKRSGALIAVVIIAFAVLMCWKMECVNTVTIAQNQVELSEQIMPESFSENLMRHYGTLGSGRLYIWIRSLQMAGETVLLGRGPDTFALYFPNQDAYKRFFNQPDVFIDKPHNLYIQNWLNLGGLATLALLTMIILHAVRTLQLLSVAQPNGDIYFLASGIFAGWFAYLVAAIFYDSTVAVAPTFWIIFGLSLAVNQQLDSVIKAENYAQRN